METTNNYPVDYVLSNTELQEAINKAGVIVMTPTDKTTSGRAREYAADCLRELFKLQIERTKMIKANNEYIPKTNSN